MCFIEVDLLSEREKLPLTCTGRPVRMGSGKRAQWVPGVVAAGGGQSYDVKLLSDALPAARGASAVLQRLEGGSSQAAGCRHLRRV